MVADQAAVVADQAAVVTEPAPAPPTPRISPEEAGPEPSDGFLWAVLSCTLFLPVGWYAVYRSASVKPQWAAGEYALAHRSAAAARTAALVAAVLGLVVIIAVFLWLYLSTR
ncbi:CD225/dispanin family protein [Gordonia crocea]|uniref:CD225/dispanin family protein n=1 Tax=Gordonia crocea TaxID=589162 RepID=UPI001E4004BE|nr:CD225/dispanin family protein [Gordonia crocea]